MATLGHGATSVSFSPDGSTLASGSWDGTARQWDVATGEEIATLSELNSFSLAYSPDGSTLAEAWGNTVTLWDLATGTKSASFEGHRGGVTSVSFSPDGTPWLRGQGMVPSRCGTLQNKNL